MIWPVLFRELKRESSARAVLLDACDAAFSAGGDFHWLNSMRNPKRLAEANRDGKQVIWDMRDVRLPIITAVHGHAMGLGATLALFSDVIFWARALQHHRPVCPRRKSWPAMAVAWPLAARPVRAKESLLTGDALTAAEADGWDSSTTRRPMRSTRSVHSPSRTTWQPGLPLAVQYTKLAVK